MTAEHHLTVPRTARYWTLGSAAVPDASGGEEVRDLWIACHGYGQLAAEFLAGFDVIAEPGRLVVAPEALSRFYLDPPSMDAANRRVGATWMTREDREHEIADQVTYLDALVARLLEPLAPSRPRVRVLGFSQGVATVGRWAARGAVRPSDLILWAGGFPPDVDPSDLRARLAGSAVTFAVGTRDQYLELTTVEAQLRRFEDAGIAARLRVFEGGHRLDDGTLRLIAGDVPLITAS